MSDSKIRNELDNIKKNPKILNVIHCSAGPIKKSNIYEWNVLLKGPEESNYKDGFFQLYIKFPKDYPEGPPIIKFQTPIFHPNISEKGQICVSSIGSGWESSNKNIIEVIYSVYDLLNEEPNLEHGLNEEALELYKNNKDEYNERVRNYTKEHSIVSFDNF
jgi:ubiquitin-protein ligase